MREQMETFKQHLRTLLERINTNESEDRIEHMIKVKYFLDELIQTIVFNITDNEKRFGCEATNDDMVAFFKKYRPYYKDSDLNLSYEKLAKQTDPCDAPIVRIRRRLAYLGGDIRGKFEEDLKYILERI